MTIGRLQYIIKSAVTTIGIFLLSPLVTNAQCHNWSIQGNLITSSLCAANGSFNITVSGPDAANLTNLQYGIALGANGFSVPLNSSSLFSNIPPGTYQVSMLATCGGTIVGKTTTIEMPGSYLPPSSTTLPGRGSINCGKTGSIYVSVIRGRPPYTATLTSFPSSYTGPLTASSMTGYIGFGSLPPGTYSTQTVDACGNGTTPGTATVPALDPASITLDFSPVGMISCDSVSVWKPSIRLQGTGWSGYGQGDTSFKVSAQISGGVSGPTPFEWMDYNPFTIPLLPGKTLKDCYGKTVTFTIKPFCGPNIIRAMNIPFPQSNAAVNQNCNIDMQATLFVSGLVCTPVTFSVRNTATNVLYGPFTTTASNIQTSTLPIGAYTYGYTTGDGYIGNGSFSATPISGNPYSVRIINGSNGLNNYIQGFEFTTTNANLGAKTVELFNGPAGYSFVGNWPGGAPFKVYNNQTPATSSLKFVQGNYVWKVTDKCGSYLVPVTVGPTDVYQYQVSIRDSLQLCAGKLIWPVGTATSNGQPMPFKYSVLFNGGAYLNASGAWPVFNSNDPFMATYPGVYTILPFSSPDVFTGLLFPNIYTRTLNYYYQVPATTIDINKTQGFLCVGANNTDGKIYVTGTGGIPFQGPTPYYKYFLALQGQGASGNFFANNTTGVFTNFGAAANAIYDVKVMDSCGSFSIQEVKILDLRYARLISSSNYVACANDSVMMSALYLPNATYSWTGPNGFTSNLRNPIIHNVTPSTIGVYRVVITTPQCATTIRDSTMLTMNGNPPKPLISLTCYPLPPTISIANPQSPFRYEWNLGVYIGTSYYSISQPSDTLNQIYVYARASYRAVAIDTSTGCRSMSDSIQFAGDPSDTLHASIYSPHLRVCAGDTTILVARGTTTALSYQWFKNGVVIPGATNSFYSTSLPGNYKLRIQTGPCHIDTSDEVTVVVVPLPVANITAPVTQMCPGDTIKIYADTASGYIYNWLRNGSSIPGAFASVLDVTEGGSYSLIVSNGGCARTSTPITIIKHAGPNITLAPTGNQSICIGDSIRFSTYNDPGYGYAWERNGVMIPGANTSLFTARNEGVYRVYVSNAICPKVPSVTVSVAVVLPGIDLGNDTVVCNTNSFSIPLSIDSSYTTALWSTGATGLSINVTQKGIYWVTATNLCGIFTDTFKVHALEEYAINLPPDTLICNTDNRVVLSVNSLLQNVVWNTGSNANYLAVTSPGRYWVAGQSPCGIIADTIDVRFCSPEITSVSLPPNGLCEGDCFEPTAIVTNYPQSYKWSFPGGVPDSSDAFMPGKICYANAGTYPVKLVITNAGGVDIFTSSITVNPKPVPRFKDSSVVLSYGKQMLLPTCANDATKISWYKDGQLICEDCRSITVEGKNYLSSYLCVVSNGTCVDSCTYRMKVIDIPHDVWLPDAFTPNGDGRNDLFRIITDNPNVHSVNLFVYNRWGQQIHLSHGSSDGWDGTVNGKDSETATYFWMLRYKVLGSDEVFFRKGDVQLIR